jgi:UDP-N-acetylenolpyruvoylglucosamine reductase
MKPSFVWNFRTSPTQQPLKNKTTWTIVINQNPENHDTDPRADMKNIRSDKVNQNEIESPSGGKDYPNDNLNNAYNWDHIHQIGKGLR